MRASPTVLGLMAVVACFAVGLAALRTNDEYTAAAVFGITYLIHGLRACLCLSSLLAGLFGGAVGAFVARRLAAYPPS
jgi:hypothetical protein